jgi:outer membrane protein OmpA-like peptidoglycan-associated protein/Mg-chelatase subunit ChlD
MNGSPAILRGFIVLLVICMLFSETDAQQKPNKGLEKKRDVSQRRTTSGLVSVRGDVLFDIKNVDITHFPEMSVIFSAVNNRNVFVRTLKKEDVLVLENGIQRPILSLDLIGASNRVPIDIVFVIDETGSMGPYIHAVKENIKKFAHRLRAQGFDYQLGLIRFADDPPSVPPTMTDDVGVFEQWVSEIEANGGGDIPENALEALNAATKMKYRQSSLKLAILVTDAPCFERNTPGDGTTTFTMKEMGDYLFERELRLVAVTPHEMTQYHEMAELTEGTSFDLNAPFDSVLTEIASDVTSLYALRYLSQSTLAPDSVRIDILRSEDRSPLAARKLSALEEGKRFVFEDLLFAVNQASLASEFVPELERVVRLMHVRPTMRIRVEGHADASGSHDKNVLLAQARAEAVKRYLMQSGIAPQRLEAVGYGDSRPIADNSTEEGRRLNRRTEFVILSK